MSIPSFPAGFPSVDFNSANTVAFAIDENTFGDGYAQRSASGLNNVRDTWSASWTNLSTAEKNTLMTFLRARGGWEAFYWTAPDDTERKWTARDAKEIPVDAGRWTVTATLRMEFDP